MLKSTMELYFQISMDMLIIYAWEVIKILE
jgi:hypothetical protein